MGKEKLSLIPRMIALAGIAAGIGVTLDDDVDNKPFNHCPPVNSHSIELQQTNNHYLGEPEDLSRQNFYQILDYMGACDLPAVQEAAGKSAFLWAYSYIKDSPAHFNREPIEVLFIGGESSRPDPSSSTYKIFFTQDLIFSDERTPADQAIYLMKSLRVFEDLIQIEGTAAQKTSIDRHVFETKAWLAVLPTAKSLKNQLRDPYILGFLETYESYGEQGFIEKWQNTLKIDNAPGFYP